RLSVDESCEGWAMAQDSGESDSASRYIESARPLQDRLLRRKSNAPKTQITLSVEIEDHGDLVAVAVFRARNAIFPNFHWKVSVFDSVEAHPLKKRGASVRAKTSEIFSDFAFSISACTIALPVPRKDLSGVVARPKISAVSVVYCSRPPQPMISPSMSAT